MRLDAAREMSKSLDARNRIPLQNSDLPSGIEFGRQEGNCFRLWRWRRSTAPDQQGASGRGRHAASHSVSQDVRNRLALMTDKFTTAKKEKVTAQVKQAASASGLKRSTTGEPFIRALRLYSSGLSLGSVLVLIAIGLAITFGVMGVINMAHGELMMLGAYTTWVVQQAMPGHIGISILVAIPAAFIVVRVRRSVAGTDNYPLPLWQAARDSARDVWRQPHPPAAGAFHFHRAQQIRSITPEWMSGRCG